MKRVKYFLAIAILSAVFFGCKEDERKAEGDVISTAPILNLAQNGVWLRDSTEAFVDKFLMRIAWTEARFTYGNGLPAKVGNVQYVLEMDTADFTEPIIVAQTEKLYADLSSGWLRDKLIKMYGAEIDTTKYLSLRVKTLCDKLPAPLLSNSPVLKIDPTKPEDEGSTIIEIPELTIKIKKSAECDWADIYVYAWGAEEIYGAWAGKKLTEDADGWYSFTIAGVRPIHLIMTNNASKQFDFLNDPTTGGCYEITNSTYSAIDCE